MQNTATYHTVQFVKENLTDKQTKILEVGENHALVSELNASGFQATPTDLLNFETAETFDAVLFTRSLQTFKSIDETLIKAKSLLNSTGKILVEDLASDLVDAKTADWFYELSDLVKILSGSFRETETHEANQTSLDRWKNEHRVKPVHSEKETARALDRHVGSFYSTTCPYLYRYFQTDFAELKNGEAALKKLFDWESTLIKEKAIQPIGLRIVAKQYFSYLK